MQHRLEQPTRGIYNVYTHTSERFEPEASEAQGAIVHPATRPRGAGEQLIVQSKSTVAKRVWQLVQASPEPGNGAQGQMLVLAQAYNTPWTPAFHNDEAVAAIVRYGDAYAMNANLDPQNWTGAWNFGEAIARTGHVPAFEKALDEQIDVTVPVDPNPELVFDQKKGEAVASHTLRMTRGEAWARVLRLSVDGHRLHGRRSYTNQSMLVDYGIYASNRGLETIAPEKALPEEDALRYLYEAVGILPWLGNDLPDGSHEAPLGEHYYLVTQKGLSRELGWVGTYGETILCFMREMADLSGDARLKQQLIKIQAARTIFRYPGVDPDGYRQMKLTAEIDSRTAHFPKAFGAYTAPEIGEMLGMEVPSLTKDPVSVGAAQQSLEDNQYFYTLASHVNDSNTLELMRNVDDYEIVKSLPKSSFRLPMSQGQPDFVFSDEENAVLAIKHGEDRLFVNFYYRQEHAPSGSTRILELTPQNMRVATVKAHFEVIPSGHTWIRPNIIDLERTGGFPPPGEHIDQAWAGEELEISKRPDDAKLPEYGGWGPFLGKAAFYWIQYGDYLIGLNTTDSNTYDLPVPAGVTSAPDLVTSKTFNIEGNAVKIGPRTTVVLYLGH